MVRQRATREVAPQQFTPLRAQPAHPAIARRPATPSAPLHNAIGAGSAALARATKTAAKATSAPHETRTVGVEALVFVEDGQNLHTSPDANSKVVRKLAYNTRVYVEQADVNHGWSKVTTGNGLEGYMQALALKTDLPCPGANLHIVGNGETALGIAGRYYGKDEVAGHDGRFFVNVLAYCNPSTVIQDPHGDWHKVGFRAGSSIWLPTNAFAQTLKGKVNDGSITNGLWSEAKEAVGEVIDIVVGAPAFVSGALEGAVAEIQSILQSAADVIPEAIGAIKSVISGEFLSDVVGLWNQISHLPVKQLLSEFLDQWNSKDPWTKWHFRGEVFGRVAVEVALAILSGGATEVIAESSRFARAAEWVKNLGVVRKLSDGVEASNAALVAKLRKLKGKLKLTPAERAERLKELAFDPDKGRVTAASTLEANDALDLEEAGRLPPPVRRANGKTNPKENGADFVDGSGQLWDHKIATSQYGNFNAQNFVQKIMYNDLRNHEKIILHHADLNATDLKALQAEIKKQGLESEFLFIPQL